MLRNEKMDEIEMTLADNFKLELQLFAENEEDEDIEDEELEDLDELEELEDDEDIEGDDNTPEAEEIQAEETNEKKYDDQDVDSIVAKKLNRERRKNERVVKELEAKLDRVLNLVQAGTGKETPDESVEYLEEYWRGQGIQIPEAKSNEIRGLSEKQIVLLANDEAKEVIDAGYDDIVDEVDRLAKIGVDDMSPLELEKFKILAQNREDLENAMELEKLGIKQDVFKDEKFTEFRKKFSNKTPINEVYDYYSKVNGIKQDDYEIMGSQKSNAEVKVKEYYTDAEIDKLTDEDLDNPDIYDAVMKSMEINYKKKK